MISFALLTAESGKRDNHCKEKKTVTDIHVESNRLSLFESLEVHIFYQLIGIKKVLYANEIDKKKIELQSHRARQTQNIKILIEPDH